MLAKSIPFLEPKQTSLLRQKASSIPFLFLWFHQRTFYTPLTSNSYLFKLFLVSIFLINHYFQFFTHKDCSGVRRVKAIATTWQINIPFCNVLSCCFSCTLYSMQLLRVANSPLSHAPTITRAMRFLATPFILTSRSLRLLLSSK